jgi:hypothetical protein
MGLASIISRALPAKAVTLNGFAMASHIQATQIPELGSLVG